MGLLKVRRFHTQDLTRWLINTDDFVLRRLKLGEQLINPFGDDDEDFELNWIIDRHIKVSLLGVDILNQRPPPLIRDTYFGDTGTQWGNKSFVTRY